MLYDKDKILEAISNMSVIEITELISMIEKKFSVSVNELNFNNSKNINNVEEKKDNFNLIIESVGNNKISVIKAIRSIMNLGLKESKDLIDSCPTVLKRNIEEEELKRFKKTLEDAGAILKIE